MRKKYYYLTQQQHAGILGLLKRKKIKGVEKAVRNISKQEVKKIGGKDGE